jgi:hypothetical protein
MKAAETAIVEGDDASQYGRGKVDIQTHRNDGLNKRSRMKRSEIREP